MASTSPRPSLTLVPFAPRADEAVRFGRFVIRSQLGQGGMAKVYCAVDTTGAPDREVVLKRIDRFNSRDQDMVRMFATEARISGLLDHPAIVRTEEFGYVDDEPYLIMEMVDGLDLSRALRNCRTREQPLSPALACHLIGELAGALAYAHSLADSDRRPYEIVHRDVSPSNVMVARDGRVKLLDFGIAKVASHLRAERTRTGILKGKLSYMSPEQVEGHTIDRRCDIFALGILFHECLTLERPLKGQNEIETLQLIGRADVPAPSTFVSGIPPQLDRIVLRMLARAPADRFQTCDEVVTALAPLRERLHADAETVRAWLSEIDANLARETVTREWKSKSHGEMAHASTLTELPQKLAQMRAPAAAATATPAPPTQPAAVAKSEPAAPTRAPAPLWRQTLPPAALATVVAVVWTTAVAPWLSSRGVEQSVAAAKAPVPAAARAPTVPPPAGAAVPVVAAAAAVPVGARATLAAPAALVHMRLHGPAGARVFIDNHEVGVLPLELELPRFAGMRHVSVVNGARRWSQEVAGDMENFVMVDLGPERPVRRPVRRPARPAVLLKDPFAQ